MWPLARARLMESALARMRGGENGSGLLALLDRIGPILAGTTRVSLKSIEYRNATLEIACVRPTCLHSTWYASSSPTSGSMRK